MKFLRDCPNQGKFRNEIVARQFIFRMKELANGNAVFVTPGDEMKWFNYWKNLRMKWHLALGFK